MGMREGMRGKKTTARRKPPLFFYHIDFYTGGFFCDINLNVSPFKLLQIHWADWFLSQHSNEFDTETQ